MATTEHDVLMERYEEEQYDLMRTAIRQELALAAKTGLIRTDVRHKHRGSKQGSSNGRRRTQGGGKRVSATADSSSSSSPSLTRSAVTPNALNGVLLGGVR